MKKREKARRLRPGKYSPNYLRGKKKTFQRFPVATGYSLGSTGGIQAMFSVNCSAALSPVSPGSFFAL